MSEVRSEFEVVVHKVATAWSPNEATKIYTSSIAESMTDSDIKAVITFYGSDEGKRSTVAIGEAAKKMQTYVHNETMKVMQPAMKDFGDHIKVIMANDIAQRRAAAKKKDGER